MKKIFYLFITLIANNFCHAQNLVPNGGFEQFSGCPNYAFQFDSVLIWLNPTSSTPDYFNSCDTTNSAGVPFNLFGSQYAHSGLAYSGICIYDENQPFPDYREYIEVPLNFPLIANNCYQFEMHVCLAEISGYNTYQLGVYFSDTIFSNLATSYLLPFIPQINNMPSNQFDTLNWTVVSGTYIANGGENYLIIGNFKDDFNTPHTVASNSPYLTTYIYIDDVCLSSCGNSCLTSIEEMSSLEIEVYPNPFDDKINFVIKGSGNYSVNLYDVTGRIVLNQSISNNNSINTISIAKGIYFYEIVNNKKIIKKGKVIKNQFK